ncbi:DUF3556 domain-containing protein [Gordonia sp. X0973]|uniref:DUF3556 domain-containing protein n=1 Tax=Gordonia sp. X0973 TaxID=2742602 RepID=UPI000F521B2C|nr:DUF3556 domain-containing protein [Gordonia sp. X0973]QKT08589.1 DUF3556 domain-containing protein [Gordonia sp. X0973]
MGFKEGVMPEVDPATFMDKPYLDRIKITSRFWVENGFGTPKMLPTIYVVKVVVLYLVVGIAIATLTSGLNPLHPSQWWNQPIFYQKAIMWTVFLETLGLAGSWGPLAGHFAPMTAGFKTWLRPETIRLPPWPGKVPGTAGDRRTVFDVAVYALVLVSALVTLFAPRVDATGFPGGQKVAEHLGQTNVYLVNPWLFLPVLVFLVILGLRDKVAFLAARPEQYMPAMVFGLLAPAMGVVTMLVCLKLLITVVWVGAGISKIGKHFGKVVPPMMSNTPILPGKATRRLFYRNFPEDLQPSGLAHFFAHGLGTVVEIGFPLILLLVGTPWWLVVVAVIMMIGLHAVIFSTFPLAVPLEWNVLFAFAVVFLYLGWPNKDGFGFIGSDYAWTVPVLIALVIFPILGNLRPDWVSFLPSMRQYAGNWASAQWAIKPEAEKKLEEHIVRSQPNIITQLQKAGYPEDVAEVVLSMTTGWRSLHSQGPGLMSIMRNYLGEEKFNTYRMREAEFACNSIIAFNFGEGHFHNEDLIRAIQRRCNFEPGEFLVAWVESQPIHKNYQEWKLIDAALGVVERGTYKVADSADTQPWLPNGPIPLEYTWRSDSATPAGASR